MAGSVTLSTLRTRIKQRSDQEHSGSQFVTDSELNGLINTSYAELYGHLVRSGLHMAESTSSITADGRTTAYALPADFYSVLAVFRVDGGYRYRLPRHDLRHKPSTTDFGDAGSYRVIGTGVEFSPRPRTGTYEVVYVPLPTTLAADGDTVAGVLGWEEYIVVDCAIKVLQKEESDVRVLLGERERLLARIQDEAAAREMTETFAVAITRPDEVSIDPGSEYSRSGFRGSVFSWRRY